MFSPWDKQHYSLNFPSNLLGLSSSSPQTQVHPQHVPEALYPPFPVLSLLFLQVTIEIKCSLAYSLRSLLGTNNNIQKNLFCFAVTNIKTYSHSKTNININLYT